MTSLALEPTSIASVVTTMYAMISGPAGPRDWALQDVVFHPRAQMVRTWVGADGAAQSKVMSLAEYREDTAPFFATHDFYELEIGHVIDVFGNMAQVWSAYEARNALGDEFPERRGINSIQLCRDERGHWRILAMVWDNEREGLTIGAFE